MTIVEAPNAAGVALRCTTVILLAAVMGCAATPVTPPPDLPDAAPGMVSGIEPLPPDPPDPVETPDPVDPVETRRRAVDSALAALSLEQRVGQLFMPAFPVDSHGRGLLSVDDRVRGIMGRIQPGGVLLLGLNVDSADQLTRLIADLQRIATLPLLIATDHEGGSISRISAGGRIPATRIPSPHIVGAVADSQLAYQLGAVIGRELRSLGIQVNFAPVADLRTNPDNSVIGNRSLGDDPEAVGRIVAELVRGMQDQRVAAVLKHFPGHGDTVEDSHYQAAGVRHDRERLRSVEMVPFRYGIEAGAFGVMTGHISVPAVTGDRTPATLSAELLGPVLRGELGFGSLVFSDALNMHALTRYYNRSLVAVQALEAGVDVLVHPERPLEAYRAVLEAVESGQIPAQRLDRSVRAILEAKYDLGLLGVRSGESAAADRIVDFALLGSAPHQAVVEEIVRRYQLLQQENEHD